MYMNRVLSVGFSSKYGLPAPTGLLKAKAGSLLPVGRTKKLKSWEGVGYCQKQCIYLTYQAIEMAALVGFSVYANLDLPFMTGCLPMRHPIRKKI